MPAEVKYPRETLTAHVAMKGFEVGALLGLAVDIPLNLWHKLPMGRWALRGAALGPVVTVALMMAKMKGESETGWTDRAYRLQYNKLQQQCDLLAIGGAACGGVFGKVAGLGMGRGAAIGIGVGVMGHIALGFTGSKPLLK